MRTYFTLERELLLDNEVLELIKEKKFQGTLIGSNLHFIEEYMRNPSLQWKVPKVHFRNPLLQLQWSWKHRTHGQPNIALVITPGTSGLSLEEFFQTCYMIGTLIPHNAHFPFEVEPVDTDSIIWLNFDGLGGNGTATVRNVIAERKFIKDVIPETDEDLVFSQKETAIISFGFDYNWWEGFISIPLDGI